MLTFLMDIGDGGEESNLGPAISGRESIYEGNAPDWSYKRYIRIIFTLLLQGIEGFMQYLTLIKH